MTKKALAYAKPRLRRFSPLESRHLLCDGGSAAAGAAGLGKCDNGSNAESAVTCVNTGMGAAPAAGTGCGNGLEAGPSTWDCVSGHSAVSMCEIGNYAGDEMQWCYDGGSADVCLTGGSTG